MLSQHFQIQFAGSLSACGGGVRFHFLHLSLQPSLMHQSWLPRGRLPSAHFVEKFIFTSQILAVWLLLHVFLHVMTLRGPYIPLTQSSLLPQKLPSSTLGSGWASLMLENWTKDPWASLPTILWRCSLTNRNETEIYNKKSPLLQSQVLGTAMMSLLLYWYPGTSFGSWFDSFSSSPLGSRPLIFPLICIPLCTGNLAFLLHTEKLHQEPRGVFVRHSVSQCSVIVLLAVSMLFLNWQKQQVKWLGKINFPVQGPSWGCSQLLQVTLMLFTCLNILMLAN